MYASVPFSFFLALSFLQTLSTFQNNETFQPPAFCFLELGRRGLEGSALYILLLDIMQ